MVILQLLNVILLALNFSLLVWINWQYRTSRAAKRATPTPPPAKLKSQLSPQAEQDLLGACSIKQYSVPNHGIEYLLIHSTTGLTSTGGTLQEAANNLANELAK